MTTDDLRRQQHSACIKALAHQAGFDVCGISEAAFLEQEAPRLEAWLRQGRQGHMQYMENHFDKRLDPRLLVEGARSVVTLLYNYYPPETLPEDDSSLKISKYAYGVDYHDVIRDKLNQLLQQIQHHIGQVGGRAFVDSAPVLEKAWAARSGTGWIGKHTNLISRQLGSFFFIAELVIDLDLWPDGPVPDYCGTCTRCIEACPTGAITQPYGLDASRCISYLTIELKAAIPEDFSGKMANWVFGCDICQDVCPWNRFARPHHQPAFYFSEDLKTLVTADWQHLTEAAFKRVFARSAVKRTKFRGLLRNLQFLKPQPGGQQAL